MINARLNEIMQDDDELFNRVKAYGPGDGINRVSVVVEDATSISTYGLRETTETFLDATSRADLTTKANDFLDAKKDPVSRGRVTLFMEEGDEVDIARGDTIRLASKELGLNTTTIVQELDWEPGQVNLTVGRDNYNLLEVINGPRDDAERERAALGLPTPIGFSAQRISPGIRVFINPYANSRAVGVEIYAGPTAGFEPDQSYLLVRGAGTTYDFTNLTPGDIYYFKARSYDSQGGYSDVAGPVSAIAGFVPGSRVGGGTLDLSKFVSDTRPIKIVTSLPVVVSADDPDYKVGMLVNYFTLGEDPHPYGALYRLISTTGVPSTDWVKAIDTDSIADEAVTADQILANTITANEIDAGSISTAILIADAIKANMIDARQVTADKIAVDGEVEVTNSTQSDGAFSVKNASNVEVLRLGNIDGKSGVPAAIDYGLWGALGTGVFIEGAARMVGVVEALLTASGSSNLNLAEGDVRTETASVSVSLNGSTSFTVPSGKKWIAIHTTYDHAPLGTTNLWALHRKISYTRATNSSSNLVNIVFPAGSYTGLQFYGAHRYIAVRAEAKAASGWLEYTWITFIEVDA